MKNCQNGFGRVDIQVTGILCGFHTLWFIVTGVCVRNADYGQLLVGKLAVVWFFMCVLSAVVSNRTFRRISNPGKRELWSIDLMTRLKNRNAFELDIHNLETKRPGQAIGIIMVDLDHLKTVNDAKGHAMGDVYICNAAECIQEELKGNAVAYRIGGDEFAIILPGSEKWEIENLILRIQKRFELEYRQKLGEEVFLSAGYEIYNPHDGTKLIEVLNCADKNMYKEKKKREKKSTQKIPL